MSASSAEETRDTFDLQYYPRVQHSESRINLYLTPTVNGKKASGYNTFKITFAKLMVDGLKRPYYIKSWRLPYGFDPTQLLAAYRQSPLRHESPTSEYVLDSLRGIIPALQTVCTTSVLRLRQFQQVQDHLGAEPDIEVYFCTTVAITITIKSTELTIKQSRRGHFLDVVVQVEYSWSGLVPEQFTIDPEECLGEDRVNRCQLAFEASLATRGHDLSDHLDAVIDSLFNLVVECYSSCSSPSSGRPTECEASGPTRLGSGTSSVMEGAQDTSMENTLFLSDLFESTEEEIEDWDPNWHPRSSSKRKRPINRKRNALRYNVRTTKASASLHDSKNNKSRISLGTLVVPETSSSEEESLATVSKRAIARRSLGTRVVPETSSSEEESLATIAKRLASRRSLGTRVVPETSSSEEESLATIAKRLASSDSWMISLTGQDSNGKTPGAQT